MDGGFLYFINNDLQLDLFGGYDVTNNNDEDWFISLGFSWRVYNKNDR